MGQIRADLVESIADDDSLPDDIADDTFAKAEDEVRDMFIVEEVTKVIRKAEKNKRRGFSAIQKIAASGCTVADPEVIVNAIAEGLSSDDDPE